MRYLGGGEEDGPPRGSEYALKSPERSQREDGLLASGNAGSTNGHPPLLCDECDEVSATVDGSPERYLAAKGRDLLGNLCTRYVLWLIDHQAD